MNVISGKGVWVCVINTAKDSGYWIYSNNCDYDNPNFE